METKEKTLEVIKEQIEKLEIKVHSLLYLNKINYIRDKKENLNEVVEVDEIIDKSIEKFKVVRPDIEFSVSYDKKHHTFRGSSDMWEAIIDNILGNFVRYARKSIKVTIKNNKITLYNDGPNIDNNVLNENKEAQKYLGYVPESCPLYMDMTVYEYIRYIANLWQISQIEFEDNLQMILDNLYLTDVLNQRIETLSKGFKHRVGVAGVLIHNPQILILDEPTEGLDPNQKHQIHCFIREYAKNRLVIISTHIMEEVEAISDRVILINKGKVIADTTPESLKKLTPDNNMYSAFHMLTKEC